MVGVTGFEPAASTSQTSRATNCATPRKFITFYNTLFYHIGGDLSSGLGKIMGWGKKPFRGNVTDFN